MKKAVHLLCLIVFFGGIVSCSSKQNQEITKLPSSNTILTKILEQKADEYFIKNEIDSAIYWMNLVLKMAEPTNEIQQACFFFKLGSFYFQKNSIKESISYMKYGIEIFRKHKQQIRFDDIDYRNRGIVFLANNYRILNNYDSSLFYLDNVESEINKLNKNDHYYKNWLAEIFSWKGLVYFDMCNIEKAIMYNMKAINIRKQLPGCSCVIANNYSLISEIYTYREDFVKAEQYQQKAIEIIRNCFGDSSMYYADKITDLGYLYYEAKRYKDALVCYEKKNKILLNNLQVNNPSFAYSFNNLADVYVKLGLYSKGISYFLAALKIFEENNYFQELITIYHNLGNAYSSIGEYETAKWYYKKSLDLSETTMPAKNVFTSYTYQGMGQLFIKQQNYKLALEYFNKAIHEVCILELDSNYFSSKYLQNNVLSKVELLESLYYKGYCEFKIYLKQNIFACLLESILSFQKALLLLDLIRNQYENEKSKILINNISDPLFSSYLFSLLELNKFEKNKILDNKILESIERDKYTALRSLIYLSKSLYNSDIPTHLAQYTDTIHKKIRYYENLISINEKHFGLDCSINQQLIEQVFDLVYSYDTIMQFVENKYPLYKRNINNFNYNSIGFFQKLLDDSTGLLEYYINDSILLIFVINKQTHYVYYSKIPKDLKIRKTKLIQSIQFSDNKTFIENGKYLYEKLIQPIRSHIDGLTSLIIIPDDNISDLPFEILISSDSNPDNSLQSQNYLLKQFDVTYHYSINLWSDNVMEKNTTNENQWKFTFSGFAPLAENLLNDNMEYENINMVNILPYTKPEVLGITEIFIKNCKKAEGYIGKESSEERITNGLKNSRFVHIATHSLTNAHPSDYHFLFQQNDSSSFSNLNTESKKSGNEIMSINDGKLYLAEIYNLDINSELVTISTCSSGNGSNIAGEGIISLARGFYYSGADNILYTLWSISDKHTKDFMILFYTYIESGYSIPSALRKTKIDFINSKNQLPKFWSGFILNG